MSELMYFLRFLRQITKIRIEYILGRYSDKGFAMCQAAASGRIDEVRSFLKIGVNPNSRDIEGDTVLCTAAYFGHVAIVQLLIEHGAKVNITVPPNNHTPLMMATVKLNREMVRLLLEKGANVNKQTSTGDTALLTACQGGDIEIVKMLLDHGAKVNKKASRGRTPLWIASQNGHRDIVSLLIEAGANLETRYEDNGHTPLIEAAYYGHIEVVEILLEKGADVHAINNAFNFYAPKGKYSEVEEVLKQASYKLLIKNR